MKTKEQILAHYDAYKTKCLDSRDVSRLARFFPVSDWPKLGLGLKEGFEAPQTEDYTRENVIKYLASDLSFAFEKALNRRGISSSLMFEVIKMWMWVLDDELMDCDEYAMYGLPLYKKVAVKYGLPNEIGDDYGNEDKYNED